MHTIKLLLTYYLNISVQAANLSDCRIESNRNFFLPELECSNRHSRPPLESDIYAVEQADCLAIPIEDDTVAENRAKN